MNKGKQNQLDVLSRYIEKHAKPVRLNKPVDEIIKVWEERLDYQKDIVRCQEKKIKDLEYQNKKLLDENKKLSKKTGKYENDYLKVEMRRLKDKIAMLEAELKIIKTF